MVFIQPIQELCDIHKSNQIESNSQLFGYNVDVEGGCVISTKVIKLKAIHNLILIIFSFKFAVWYPQK